MVYLKINNYKLKLTSTVSPFNFVYDPLNNKKFEHDGYLNLRELFVKKEYIEKIVEEGLRNLLLINENEIKIDLLKDSINYSFNHLKKDENLLTINLNYMNIFEQYKKFINFMSKSFILPKHTYDCFTTSYVCNLSCPYCFQGSIHNKNDYKRKIFYNYYEDDIKEIMEINKKTLSVNKHSARIMGGEPFVDFDTFKYVFNKTNTLLDNIDDLWIYSNFTTNIDKFSNYIEYMLKKVKKITIVITSDTFDCKKSLRIPNQSLMVKHIENLKLITKKYSNNPRIRIASSLIFIDKKTTLNTAIELVKLGIEFLQITFDEFTPPSKCKQIQKNITSIYNILEKLNFSRLKPNLGKYVWLHFSIIENHIEIYRSKLAFSCDYTISKSNDY